MTQTRRLSAARSVFVDYDGTITNLDTFDVLVRHYVGPGPWEWYETQLRDGAMSLREVLAAQASHIGVSLDEADALLRERTHFDPTFAPFVRRCAAEGVAVSVLSSGVLPLIERAFARAGLENVSIYANGVDPRPEGWRFIFRDDSLNGHDKAAAVRSARESGIHTIFVGDGPSDFDAARIADERFAKRGRALEQHLAEHGLPFTPFERFSEIEPLLF